LIFKYFYFFKTNNTFLKGKLTKNKTNGINLI
jgi:hypothetical protein